MLLSQDEAYEPRGAAMGKRKTDMSNLLKTYKKTAMVQLMDQQATQSFSGTLKIKLDRVFVDKKDGRRALKDLRDLRSERLPKAV